MHIERLPKITLAEAAGSATTDDGNEIHAATGKERSPVVEHEIDVTSGTAV